MNFKKLNHTSPEPSFMTNIFETPSFFRPSSRPSSPAPPVVPLRLESGQTLERHSRSLNKLSLSNLIRQPLSRAPSPTHTAPLLVQDGSYLEMLSLKLSEAVSKALAPPNGPPSANEQMEAKRLIPTGRGIALGSLIASELKAVCDNPHLHRAVLRSLQRPFTVLLTNLSRQLLPLLLAPTFHSTPNISNQFSFPNPIQLHALSIAKFAEELLQVFDKHSLGLDSDVRGDGLRPIREGFASLINRVVNPLITGIRMELIPLMDALEHPNTCNAKSLVGTKSTIVYHPSIVSLQTLMPVYARALTTYTTSTLSHSTLASLLISVLWRALVALSYRIDVNISPPLTPLGSPLLASKKRGTATPSPPPTSKVTKASAVMDCKVLCDLLDQLPRPSAGAASTELAKEAVDQAFEGLRTLPTLLDIANNKSHFGIADDDLIKKFNDLTTKIPSLIALPIILRAFSGPGMSSVSAMLGISEEEYRKGCLSGFGRAEECTVTVAQCVMDELKTDASKNAIVIRWLDMELAETDDT